MRMATRYLESGQRVRAVSSAAGVRIVASASRVRASTAAAPVIDRLPDYGGPSYVIPSMVAQVLETAGHSMAADVEVAPIPHYMTSNEAGGYTAVIGN